MLFSFAFIPSQPAFTRLFLFLLFLYGCDTASAAQVMPVPVKAWETHRKHYPDAESAEWAKQDEGYVVSFYNPKLQQAVSMRFDAKGKWLETLTAIPVESLPTIINTYLAGRFEQYYATAFETQERKNKYFYHLVIDTPTHLFTLTFTAKGQLVKEYSEGIDGD